MSSDTAIRQLTARVLRAPLTPIQAAKLFPPVKGGRPCSPQTVTRLCLKGIRLSDGSLLKLAHIKYNRKLLTCQECILDFIHAQQQPAGATSQPEIRSLAQRIRDSEAAGEELAAMGVH